MKIDFSLVLLNCCLLFFFTQMLACACVFSHNVLALLHAKRTSMKKNCMLSSLLFFLFSLDILHAQLFSFKFND